MTEEIPTKTQASEPDAEILVIQDTLDKFIATADVEIVYGEPIQHGETVIIPTAEVLTGMGFGLIYGSGKSQREDNGDESSGGGGGGGVRVEPVVDITKIGLAILTAAGFMFGMILRMTGSRGSITE
jgi:uncharacterized spore protein YtfJ